MKARQYARKTEQDMSGISAANLLRTRPFQPSNTHNQQTLRTQEGLEPITKGFDLTKGHSFPIASDPSSPVGQPLQAKLTVGAVDDKYEREADRVATQVVDQIYAVGMGQPLILQSEEQISRKPEMRWLPEVQRSLLAGGEASSDLESAINRSRGSGQPLDTGLQQSMGQAMGTNFSQVRVHTGAQADALNQSIHAKAFTTGQDVFFRQGEYQPGSRKGQELIAHELTHVVQQNHQVAQKDTRVDSQPEVNMELLGSSTLRLAPVIQRQIEAKDLLEKIDLDMYYLNKYKKLPEDDTIPEELSKRAKELAIIATKFETTAEKNHWKRLWLITNFQYALIDGKDDKAIIQIAATYWKENKIPVPEEYRKQTALYTEEEIEHFKTQLKLGREAEDTEATKKLTSAGEKMSKSYPDIQWVGSGPDPQNENKPAIDKGEKGKNNFAQWICALIDKDPQAPSYAPTSSGKYQMNCWEGVMFTAYEAKLVDEKWLKAVHEKASKDAKTYFDTIATSLGYNSAVPYDEENGLVPKAGDIVFFDKAEHIALALGEGKIMHLWHNTEGKGKGFEESFFEAIFLSRSDLRLKTTFAPNPFKTPK